MDDEMSEQYLIMDKNLRIVREGISSMFGLTLKQMGFEKEYKSVLVDLGGFWRCTLPFAHPVPMRENSDGILTRHEYYLVKIVGTEKEYQRFVVEIIVGFDNDYKYDRVDNHDPFSTSYQR